MTSSPSGIKVKLVWQGFGMTEIYTNAYYEHEPDVAPKNSLGHPVSWMDYGVVDEHDRMLGPGEVGELVFRPRLPTPWPGLLQSARGHRSDVP